MLPDNTPVILSAVRTPIGRFLGGLSTLTAPQLGAVAIREAVARAGIAPGDVQECFIGQVVQGGSGQAPARQAMIHAGLSADASAVTINEVCGSGLRAVMLAATQVLAGQREVLVAGGQESMSTAPHYVYGMRGGIKAGNQTMVDGMIHDGLWDSFGGNHMGEYAEYTAEQAGVSRAEQDAWAAESHRRAVAAMDGGKFTAEVVPVGVPGPKGATTTVAADECPRRDTTAESLAKLKPAFRKDGTVTAGNAPGLNDGASAVVVTSLGYARAHGLAPRARVTAMATGGGAPKELFFAPIRAVQALMRKEGKAIGDYDLIEANEAFAVVAIADGRGLGWDDARVNVHGGAVALGHPIGASGARVLTTLLHALEDRNLATGCATLCLGGGNAVAVSIERI
ncbi:MAG: acetyl-CoA C-acyltransferase [Gemmatimonadales bacterium]|nr:acetyl-CoA C-acyltransferase [Gemmatimonadales bacterium]